MKDVLWTLLISVLGPFLACLAIWAAVRRPLGRYTIVQHALCGHCRSILETRPPHL
jgi:hypothetical protein